MKHYERYFKGIYFGNYTFIKFFLKRQNVPEELAEDLIQDVFLKYFQKRYEFTERDARRFLITSVRNALIDDYRKAVQRKKLCDSSNFESLHCETTNHEQKVELTRIARTITDQARRDKQMCFYLFYGAGFSVKKISHELGKPIGTVSSQIARTRSLYRKKFEALRPQGI
ncbi:MAG: sigma-70 family RNA polymerase sigma factor [Pseudobacteriovorax sp.]|nr:sigma-70 family RNA polymerase sigma factor [Pseudobacteriovorax sp.]